VRVRREVRRRSGGQCEYVDAQTHRRCESRQQLQLDHVIPFARGGQATTENLRHHCFAHNALAAIDAFGREKLRRYLRL
jgi:hypothetical protein